VSIFSSNSHSLDVRPDNVLHIGRWVPSCVYSYISMVSDVCIIKVWTCICCRWL